MPNDNGADSQAPRNQVPDLRWLFGAQVIIVATAIGLFVDGIVMALAVGAVAGFALQFLFKDLTDDKLRMALNAASVYPALAGVTFLAIGLTQGLTNRTPILHGVALVALGVLTRAIYEDHIDDLQESA